MSNQERDLLEAVLAGCPDGVPDAQRPVFDALTALRAAPSAAELSAEAAARAEFRAVMHGAGAGDPALTLILPAGQAGAPPRRAARHRRTTRSLFPLSPAVLLTGAAAAVFLLVIGLTALVPGPLRSIANLVHTPSATPSAPRSTAQGTASMPGVQGTATAQPSHRPLATHSAVPPAQPTPATLCREYFTLFTARPQTAADMRAEQRLGEQLSKLAGGPFQVWGYCAKQLYGKDRKPHQWPGFPPHPGGNQGNQGNTGTQGNNTGQSGYSGQSGNNTSQGGTGTQSGYGAQTGTGSQPGYGAQTGYGKPGRLRQPDRPDSGTWMSAGAPFPPFRGLSVPGERLDDRGAGLLERGALCRGQPVED